MTDKIDTSPEAVDRRVTFQDETPKTSDCVLCLYCGGSLHNPEHGIFWKQTTGHYCAEQQIKDLSARAEAAEAALFRAYQMGRDAASKHIFTMEHDGTKPDWINLGSWAFTIEQAAWRAGQVQPPADLLTSDE